MLLKNAQMPSAVAESEIVQVREEGNRPATRWWRLALPLGVGILLLVLSVAVLAAMPSWRSPALSSAVPAPKKLVPANSEAPAEAQPQAPAYKPAPPAADASVAMEQQSLDRDVVARVNQQTIERATLEVMQGVDRAMATLLGSPVSAQQDEVERLVNGTLVLQAAQAAGFTLADDAVEQAIQAFLSGKGKSIQELEHALAEQQISWEAFTTYFGQLLVIRQFSAAEAQARGMTVAEYLNSLQRKARISFGPVAEETWAQVPRQVGTALAEAEPEGQTLGPSRNLETDAEEPVPVQESIASIPQSPAVPRGTGKGQYAPLFDLPGVNYPEGERLALESFAGRPILLSFWTTWCPYCLRQTPLLVEAYHRYADQGVQFIGIDVKENRAKVEAYIAKHQMPYPVGLDDAGEVAKLYSVTGFPTTYFLDAEGRVVARHIGQLSAQKVDDYLQQLILPDER